MTTETDTARMRPGPLFCGQHFNFQRKASLLVGEIGPSSKSSGLPGFLHAATRDTLAEAIGVVPSYVLDGYENSPD